MSIKRKIAQLANAPDEAVQHDAPKSETPPRSFKIARNGLSTGSDMINLLTATITDVLEEAITTSQGYVVVSAVGKILKVVDLQFKYGRPKTDGARDRDLVLVPSKTAGSVQ